MSFFIRDLSSSAILTVNYRLKTGHRGQALQIEVNRGAESVIYQRTHRRAFDLFDSPTAEYGSFFSSSRQFAAALHGSVLLDLGCGNGGLVADLRRLGLQATGMDLYLEEEALPNRYLKIGDAFRTGLSESSVDVITSSYSVYHYEPLARLREVLTESVRILSPRGRILLSPIHDSPRLEYLRTLSRKCGLTFWQAPENKAIQILKIPFGNPSRVP